jgi:glutamate-1-semialdehyde 2,1-aminomutase
VNETINLNSLALYGAVALVALTGITRIKQRAELSLAKHRSLAGHPRNARRLASLLPSYRYDEGHAFGVDGAPDDVVTRRKVAFDALLTQFQTRYPKSLQETANVVNGLSDLQFTSAYRIPFQFRTLAGKGLKIASFVQSTSGVTVTDLDGNILYDLTGSYGVNLFGNDFYKDCIDQGARMVGQLGPVLGSYHPVVVDNVKRLRQISAMDEVSFHMSGTEAVMQAVRLARYHSGRNKIVRFCGSYHGWWGDVQPGIGNPVTEKDTFTLSEMSEATLKVLRNRNDIACVLVNPLQALHPNVAAPGDSSLLDSSRKAGFSKADYTGWLNELRKVCDAKGIALIFDEVFVGFRLALGGAQEYFGIHADMVTYGKTLGGGLPVGVLCGKASWMKRFREDAPGDICFARGTFNSHPYVMGAMNVFLKSLETPVIQVYYADLDATWNNRAHALNQLFQEANIPLQVANLSSIWTVLYTRPACYNWLFQYYLRLEGLALSWVGTGRIVFSLNYTQEDFDGVSRSFIRAAENMQRDGWWLSDPTLTNKSIKRRILREMLKAKLNPAS